MNTHTENLLKVNFLRLSYTARRNYFCQLLASVLFFRLCGFFLFLYGVNISVVGMQLKSQKQNSRYSVLEKHSRCVQNV